MCGFTVITNSDQNTNNLDLAFSQLRKINKHRGPDDFRILHSVVSYSVLWLLRFLLFLVLTCLYDYVSFVIQVTVLLGPINGK